MMLLAWLLAVLAMLTLLVAALGVMRLPDALSRQHDVLEEPGHLRNGDGEQGGRFSESRLRKRDHRRYVRDVQQRGPTRAHQGSIGLSRSLPLATTSTPFTVGA